MKFGNIICLRLAGVLFRCSDMRESVNLPIDSVVMSVYNGERLLREVIESACHDP